MKSPAMAVMIVLSTFAAASPAQTGDARPFLVEEAVTSFPTTLDPHRLFWFAANRILMLAYEPPLQCDPDAEVLEIVPLLLEELPKLDPEGRVMTFRFRSGIRFHDDPCFPDGKGRELIAQDFVETIFRHVDPDTRSPYFPAYVLDRIEGLDELRVEAEHQRAMDYEAEVEGLKATSRYDVRIKFKRPFPQFTALMTMPWLAIVPREAVRHYGSGLDTHPVGTGPYVPDHDATTKDVLAFARNPRYWNAAAGGAAGPLPRNAGVRFHRVPEVDNWEKRFALGDLTALDLWGTNLERFLTPRGAIRPSVRPRRSSLLRTDLVNLHYIAFNTRNKILGDRKVRQALALTFDRQRYVDECLKGAATLADHPVPPSIPMFTPLQRYPWEFGETDVKRARTLLAEAGFPDGKGLPEFIVDFGYEGEVAQTEARIMAESWARIGVRIQPRYQPFAEFLPRVRQGLTEISINFWFADYPDPENFLLMLETSRAPSPETTMDSPNVGYYSNREYDRMYEEASRLAPGKERGRIFARMIRIIQDDCPWIFVNHDYQYGLLSTDVSGVSSRSGYVYNTSRIKRVPSAEDGR